MLRPARLVPYLLAAALAAPAPPLAAQAAGPRVDPRLAQAREHLDRGQPEEALALLDRVLKKGKPSAEALLLRSTGRVMTADVAGGFEDLQRALELDPTLRQGWLNLAGLEIAEGRYPEAYAALLEAQKLDPAAVDNHLNLGAVLVLQGELDAADGHFRQYLERAGATAEAYYLVAVNYVLAGLVEPTVENLRRAFELDERLRLKARSDDRFLTLEDPRFQDLLTTDLYTPPPGAHTRAAAFRVPYDPEDNRLLYAVLEALDQLGVRYDPSVETTPGWALIWADARIKVYNQSGGTGVVSLSAPADRFAAADWHRRTQELFRTIHGILGE